MQQLLKEIEDGFKAERVTDVKSGDTVKIFQKIREGEKERIQLFEGLVINVRRKNSRTATITVRKIASGVGVERTFQLNSPLIQKVEVVRRGKVRKKNLVYMRDRSGKSSRLTSLLFDKELVNYIPEVEDKGALPAALKKTVEEASKEETEIVLDTEDKSIEQKV